MHNDTVGRPPAAGPLPIATEIVAFSVRSDGGGLAAVAAGHRADLVDEARLPADQAGPGPAADDDGGRAPGAGAVVPSPAPPAPRREVEHRPPAAPRAGAPDGPRGASGVASWPRRRGPGRAGAAVWLGLAIGLAGWYRRRRRGPVPGPDTSPASPPPVPACDPLRRAREAHQRLEGVAAAGPSQDVAVLLRWLEQLPLPPAPAHLAMSARLERHLVYRAVGEAARQASRPVDSDTSVSANRLVNALWRRKISAPPLAAAEVEDFGDDEVEFWAMSRQVADELGRLVVGDGPRAGGDLTWTGRAERLERWLTLLDEVSRQAVVGQMTQLPDAAAVEATRRRLLAGRLAGRRILGCLAQRRDYEAGARARSPAIAVRAIGRGRGREKMGLRARLAQGVFGPGGDDPPAAARAGASREQS